MQVHPTPTLCPCLLPAEKGNLQLVVTIYEAAEESRGTMSTRADLLNHPLTNGQTLLMRACYNG